MQEKIAFYINGQEENYSKDDVLSNGQPPGKKNKVGSIPHKLYANKFQIYQSFKCERIKLVTTRSKQRRIVPYILKWGRG